MDEKSILNLFSQFTQSPAENEGKTGESNQPLVDVLKSVSGQFGAPLQEAVSQFLSGTGELHEATRAAAARNSKSAASEVAKMLTSRFNLSPVIANLVGSVLVNLLPSLGKQFASGSAKEEKPRPKTKPKPKPVSSAKKTDKKTSAKPKTSSSKPASSKTGSKTTKKTTSSTARRKNSTRTNTVEIEPS